MPAAAPAVVPGQQLPALAEWLPVVAVLFAVEPAVVPGEAAAAAVAAAAEAAAYECIAFVLG